MVCVSEPDAVGAAIGLFNRPLRPTRFGINCIAWAHSSWWRRSVWPQHGRCWKTRCIRKGVYPQARPKQDSYPNKYYVHGLDEFLGNGCTVHQRGVTDFRLYPLCSPEIVRVPKSFPMTAACVDRHPASCLRPSHEWLLLTRLSTSRGKVNQAFGGQCFTLHFWKQTCGTS